MGWVAVAAFVGFLVGGVVAIVVLDRVIFRSGFGGWR